MLYYLTIFLYKIIVEWKWQLYEQHTVDFFKGKIKNYNIEKENSPNPKSRLAEITAHTKLKFPKYKP